MNQLTGFLKFSEEDVFGEGCLPDTATSTVFQLNFTGDSPAEVIGKACDSVELNACDEIGRVDIATMECGDGSRPTAYETEQWKIGKWRLWYVVYTGYVQAIHAADLSEVEL
jgi:hypothetical protein